MREFQLDAEHKWEEGREEAGEGFIALELFISRVIIKLKGREGFCQKRERDERQKALPRPGRRSL